jgi:hypothetical protein
LPPHFERSNITDPFHHLKSIYLSRDHATISLLRRSFYR